MKEIWLTYYNPPTQTAWVKKPHGNNNEYFRGVVQCVDMTDIQFTPDSSLTKFGLIGFACDEGIRRENGRLGAKEGPRYLREALAELPFHHPNESIIYDLGDIHCENGQLESAQEALACLVAQALILGIKPIVMGGGHETAWGHYQGIRKVYPERYLGIINFDAHFNLSLPPDDLESSASSTFLQMAASSNKENMDFDYTCIGIQRSANTASIFERADQLAVNYVLAEEVVPNNFEHTLTLIDDVLDREQFVYISVSLDVLAQSAAPGVGSPQPLGLMPWQLKQLLRYLAHSQEVVSFELTELCPALDRDNQTASLGAILISEYIHHS